MPVEQRRTMWHTLYPKTTGNTGNLTKHKESTMKEHHIEADKFTRAGNKSERTVDDYF